MTLLGEKVLRELARLNHAVAVDAAERLSELPGVRLLNHGFFNEFTLVLDSDARLVVRELADRNILGGVSLGRLRSEEHTSELQSLMRLSYAVLCSKKKNQHCCNQDVRYIIDTCIPAYIVT